MTEGLWVKSLPTIDRCSRALRNGWLVPLGVALVMAGMLLPAPQPAGAQVHAGVQAAVGSDSGVGLGGRILFPLRLGTDFIDGAADGTYFLGGDVDSWIDVNVNVRFAVPLAADFATRVGAGLNASFISFETPPGPTTRTDTDFGFNLLVGFEYPREGVFDGRAIPFGELRTVIGGSEQVIFTLGLVFGPGGP